MWSSRPSWATWFQASRQSETQLHTTLYSKSTGMRIGEILNPGPVALFLQGSIPHFLRFCCLSTVLVTCDQLQSENVEWQVPEINNPYSLHRTFWAARWRHSHPFLFHLGRWVIPLPSAPTLNNLFALQSITCLLIRLSDSNTIVLVFKDSFYLKTGPKCRSSHAVNSDMSKRSVFFVWEKVKVLDFTWGRGSYGNVYNNKSIELEK